MNFWRENINILPSFTQRYNGRHYITSLHLKTTSGLSILLHGFKLLTDAALCYKTYRQLASTTCISDHAVPIMSME